MYPTPYSPRVIEITERMMRVQQWALPRALAFALETVERNPTPTAPQPTRRVSRAERSERTLEHFQHRARTLHARRLTHTGAAL